MIPEGFTTLYAFLALVAPGLLFEMLRERRRPALAESAFREAGRVALTSLVFTTAAVLLLTAVSLLVPGSLPDLASWVSEGEEYAQSHFWLIVTGIAAEVGLACLLVYGTDRYLRRGDSAAHPIVHGDIWNPLFSSDLTRDQVAWVKVELISGEVYWGYVDYFTIGRDLSDREIVLKGPNMQLQGAKARQPKEETYWKYILIKYSEIRAIKVRYEPRAKS